MHENIAFTFIFEILETRNFSRYVCVFQILKTELLKYILFSFMFLGRLGSPAKFSLSGFQQNQPFEDPRVKGAKNIV